MGYLNFLTLLCNTCEADHESLSSFVVITVLSKPTLLLEFAATFLAYNYNDNRFDLANIGNEHGKTSLEILDTWLVGACLVMRRKHHGLNHQT